MAKRQANQDNTDANRTNGGGGRFFWGLVIGIATGLVVAILFAPQPGEVTREQLAEQTAQMRKRGQDRYAELRSQWRGRMGEAIDAGREAQQRARDQILSQYSQSKHNGQ